MIWYRLTDARGWVGWTNCRDHAGAVSRDRGRWPVTVGVCDEICGEPRESWMWTGANWQRVI